MMTAELPDLEQTAESVMPTTSRTREAEQKKKSIFDRDGVMVMAVRLRVRTISDPRSIPDHMMAP